MDSINTHNNHIQNPEEGENIVNHEARIIKTKNPSGFEELRAAIATLLQEEAATALADVVPQEQSPNSSRGASITNGHPHPPQDHANDGGNLGINYNATTTGNHSGPLVTDDENRTESDDDVPVESNDD